MPTNPPDSDWPMPRRNYQAELQPMRNITPPTSGPAAQMGQAMNEGGANETHPVEGRRDVPVQHRQHHAGAGREAGKLIWENQIPRFAALMAATALRLLDVFTNTTDAHLVALNAATGKIAWNIAGEQRHATTGG